MGRRYMEQSRDMPRGFEDRRRWFQDLAGETSSNAGDAAEAKASLLDQMNAMRKIRFNCAKRLEKKAEVKSWVQNFLSLFTIVAGVLSLLPATEGELHYRNAFSVAVIGISVVAILISLQDSVAELIKQSVEAHRCGREISELRSRLKHREISTPEAAHEYERVVSGYSDNHENCDTYLVKWQSLRTDQRNYWSTAFIRGRINTKISEHSSIIHATLGLAVVLAAIFFNAAISK